MNKVGRYVSLLLAVQLPLACSDETARPPVENRAMGGGASAQPAARQQNPPERLVLALGDSLYAGFGLEQSQSFPEVLERELEERDIAAEVVNAGVSGDTTAGGLARLAFTLDGLERKPDLAIVGLGANDALRGLDPAETRRNLDAIMAELKRREIPVLLTGMMAPRNLDNAYLRSFDGIFSDLAKRYDAALYPFFLEGVITRPELLLPDGMHPNPAGVRHVAERVAPLAAQELKEDEAASAPAG